MKVTKKVTLKKFMAELARPGREDQSEVMAGASVSRGWCHIDGYAT